MDPMVKEKKAGCLRLPDNIDSLHFGVNARNIHSFELLDNRDSGIPEATPILSRTALP